MVRATVVAIALVVAAPARADDAAATRLGQAFTAYDRGDLAAATAALDGLAPEALANPDYLLWLRGQVALADDRPADAARDFAALTAIAGSRFATAAAWRSADAAWAWVSAQRRPRTYAALRARADADDHADLGVVAYRVALAAGERDAAAGQAALREFLREFPAHPLAGEVERALVDAGAAPTLTADERIARAQRLIAGHHWDAAVARAERPRRATAGAAEIRRDYWLGTALFKMRRRYAEAGRLLLGVAGPMGSAEALFHGRARAVAGRSRRRGHRPLPRGRAALPEDPVGPRRRST
jgi:DnaJ-domain-containing protein 1